MHYDYYTYLILELLMVFLDTLRPMSDSFMHFSCPVDLTDTDHHLSRPLPHPLNTRIHSIGLHTNHKCITSCEGDREGRLLTSLALAVTSLMDKIMVSCTCSNHFSTAPRAAEVEMALVKSTFSPSLLNMAIMSRFFSNSSL